MTECTLTDIGKNNLKLKVQLIITVELKLIVKNVNNDSFGVDEVIGLSCLYYT